MSENLKESEVEGITGPSAGVKSVDTQSASLLARRKMLLTSIGKSSALVAVVAVPMQSLAAIGTTSRTGIDGKRCTISGVMSGVHSRETVTAVCTGRRGTYYNVVTNWPNYSSTNLTAINGITGSNSSATFSKDTPFNNNGIFGSGISTKLIDIFNGSTSTEYYHWATALLNGTLGSTAVNFPYTAQQVIDLYNDPAKRAAALAFFTTYMETA